MMVARHISEFLATDNAEPATIRKELAESIEANSAHGSDSDENAAIEIAYFFNPEQIVGKLTTLPTGENLLSKIANAKPGDALVLTRRV